MDAVLCRPHSSWASEVFGVKSTNPFAIQWWGLLDFPVGSGIADTSLDIKVTVCVVLTATSSTAGMCHPERNKWKGPLCHPVSMKEMT